MIGGVTMQALRWHGAGDLRLEQVPEPTLPGLGEAIVRVSWCGICGTDLHEYTEGPVMIRSGPHPLTGDSPPLTLGHEFSGSVVAVGADVDEAMIGRRVVVDPCWRCGDCQWCRRGEYHICRSGGSVGLASDGALAELVRVQAAGLVPIPDGVDDRTAALAEPLAVGLHGVRRGGVEVGDHVLVVGAGPIGCAVILAAKAAGAASIHVSEPNPSRRDLARRIGATHVHDPTTADVRRTVYLETGRVGADVVLECTGVPALLPGAIDMVRRGGRVVLLSIGEGLAEIDPKQVTLYERTLVGSLGYQHDIPRVLALIAAGRLDPEPLITECVPLERAIDDAFGALLNGDGQQMKILVDVGGHADDGGGEVLDA